MKQDRANLLPGRTTLPLIGAALAACAHDMPPVVGLDEDLRCVAEALVAEGRAPGISIAHATAEGDVHVVGTSAELLSLGQAMLRGGGPLLSQQTVDLAFTPVATADGRRLPTGLGWQLGEHDGVRFARHLGGGAGFKSELRVYPDRAVAIAVLANETSFDTAVLTERLVASAATRGNRCRRIPNEKRGLASAQKRALHWTDDRCRRTDD